MLEWSILCQLVDAVTKKNYHMKHHELSKQVGEDLVPDHPNRRLMRKILNLVPAISSVDSIAAVKTAAATAALGAD